MTFQLAMSIVAFFLACLAFGATVMSVVAYRRLMRRYQEALNRLVAVQQGRRYGDETRQR